MSQSSIFKILAVEVLMYEFFVFVGMSRINPQRQRIHRMLTEILGGSHYSRISVLTPYYYEIGEKLIL